MKPRLSSARHRLDTSRLASARARQPVPAAGRRAADRHVRRGHADARRPGVSRVVRRRDRRVFRLRAAVDHDGQATLAGGTDPDVRGLVRGRDRNRGPDLRERRHDQRPRIAPGAADRCDVVHRATASRVDVRCGRSARRARAANADDVRCARRRQRLRIGRHHRRTHIHRHARRRAAGAEPARKRRARAPARGGRRQPRRAEPVHRAAPAREHPGRGRERHDPPDQRIGRAAAARRDHPAGNPARRSLAASAVPAGNVAPARGRLAAQHAHDARLRRRQPRSSRTSSRSTAAARDRRWSSWRTRR